MYFEELHKAYITIYDGIRHNSVLLGQYDPCHYTIETMTNLNIMLFDYVDSKHCYVRAKLIALHDWKKAVQGIPYTSQPLFTNNCAGQDKNND